MATEQPLAPSAAPEVPAWWRVHDIAIGILAGFGVGVIAGLFAIRLVETNAIVAVGGAIGAILGAMALWRSRRQQGGFVNAIVIIAWVALGLSAVFLTVLVLAILNFE